MLKSELKTLLVNQHSMACSNAPIQLNVETCKGK